MRLALAALCLAATAALQPSAAADKPVTIGLMADTYDDLPLSIRIANALDHRDNLRVIPMAGQGPLQSLNDLVHLKGVDAAILPSDTLAYAQQHALLDVAPSKISFLLKLASRDLVLVARKDIASLSDLAGKRVGVGSTGDAAYVSAQLLLEAAQVTADESPLTGAGALAALGDGALDAAFLSGDGTAAQLAAFKARGFHLVPLEAPDSLASAFAPALLTATQYPKLLRKAESVETVSSALIVAVFEWPKGSPQSLMLKRFGAQLFASLGGGGEAGINMAAAVPGWTRSKVADDLLASGAASIQPASGEN